MAPKTEPEHPASNPHSRIPPRGNSEGAGGRVDAVRYGSEGGLALLRAQSELYGEFESLARRQRQLIHEDDAGPLLTLLADRQKLSHKLTLIADELEPIRRDWAAFRTRLSPPLRSEADSLLAETKGRVQRVIETDEEDARLLSARKEAAGRAVGATHATGAALRAYRVDSARSGSMDRLDGDPS